MVKSFSDEQLPARLRDLPPLTQHEAAWLAGVAEDALERMTIAAGVVMAAGPDGEKRIALTPLVRMGFALLGQSESQAAMLRMQLAAALKREKELAGALQNRLDALIGAMEPPAEEPPSPVPVRPPLPQVTSAKPIKGKKGK